MGKMNENGEIYAIHDRETAIHMARHGTANDFVNFWGSI